MRTLLAVGTAFALAGPAAADDPKAVVEKAVKAVGGAEKIDKYKGAKIKTKGTVVLRDNPVEFTQEIAVDNAGKVREVTALSLMGQAINQTVVFDGKTGFIQANGMTHDMPEALAAELRESGNLVRVNRLTALLKGDDYTLTAAGEATVNGKPAAGVKVSAKGYRDVTVYFDKATGLPAKTERKVVDWQTGKEMAEERVIGGYMEVEGMQTPKKSTVMRDGKKFVESEVLEVKPLETVDPKTFEKPAE